MSPASALLFAFATTLVQPDRRPTVTVTAEDAQIVDLAVQWRSMTGPAGGRYDRYGWEARSYNQLLAADTVSDTTVAVRILRPMLPDSHVVRIYVRGVGPDGAGPWGWASLPLVVAGRSAGNVPERRPVAGSPERAPPPTPAGARRLPTDRRGGSHEPDAFQTIGGRTFATKASTPADSGRGAGAFPVGGSEGFDPFEHRFSTLTIASDPNAPLSAPGVLRVAFSEGDPGGRAPALVRSAASRWRAVRDLYVRYAFRLSESFIVTRLSDARLFGYDLDWNLGIADMIVAVGGGEYQYQTDLRGTRPACQRARGYPAAGNAGTIAPGRWYIVEVLIGAGDPGMCNGTLQVWINGRSVIDARGVGLGEPGTTTSAFRGVRFEPIWEVSGRSVPRSFAIDLDDLYVSGR